MQRSYTYPAPSVQYSRPPTAPYYLPPPTTGTGTGTLSSSSSVPTPVSLNTRRAIDTIHTLLSRSTTYNEHFTPCYNSRLQPNSRLNYSVRSTLSQRPWTSENRGKYNTDFPTSPPFSPYIEYEQAEGDSSGDLSDNDRGHKSSKNELKSEVLKEKDGKKGITAASFGKQEDTAAPLEQGNAVEKEAEVTKTADSGTQTEEVYFEKVASPKLQQLQSGVVDKSSQQTESPAQSHSQSPRKPIDVLTARLYKLPLIDPPTPPNESPVHSNQPATSPTLENQGKLFSRSADRSNSSHKQQDHMTHQRPQSVSRKLHSLSKRGQRDDARSAKDGGLVATPPRTVESTRRMLQVFNGYSKSNVLKHFGQQYQDVVPDLRKFGTREGKRHVINGFNAYYYH